MNIIHFDLGTNMAFAHNAEGAVVTGHFVADGPRAQRAAQILRWLNNCIAMWQITDVKFDVCHYERPFGRGFDATRCGWGIAGIIEAAFGGNTVVLDTTPQSIKSFALGSKKIARKKMTSAERRKAAAAEKLAMIARAQELGYSGSNEHEADAFLGLKYAEAFCRKEAPCPSIPVKSPASTKSTAPSTTSRKRKAALDTKSNAPTRKRSRSA